MISVMEDSQPFSKCARIHNRASALAGQAKILAPLLWRWQTRPWRPHAPTFSCGLLTYANTVYGLRSQRMATTEHDALLTTSRLADRLRPKFGFHHVMNPFVLQLRAALPPSQLAWRVQKENSEFSFSELTVVPWRRLMPVPHDATP